MKAGAIQYSFSKYVGDRIDLEAPEAASTSTHPNFWCADWQVTGSNADCLHLWYTHTDTKYNVVDISKYFVGSIAIKCVVTYYDRSGKYSGEMKRSFTYTISCEAVYLNVDPKNMKLKVGETQRITCNPSTGHSPTIRYDSNRDNVASVSGDGNVSGNSVGTAVITVYNNMGPDEKVNVTVEPSPNPKIQLSASPWGGEVSAGTKVYLSTTNVSGCDIYYTLNGKEPSKSDGIKYASSGITINSSCTLKAIAYKSGYEDSDVLTVSYTVKDDFGSLSNPFNAVAATNKAGELGENETSTQSYYIKGKISSIKYPYNAQYGTATFYISDDGTTKDQFYVYGSYYLENKSWEEGNPQIEIGDDVIIYGKLANYKGTLETASKENHIYSHNGKTKILASSTCADIIAGKDDDVYRVTGIVKSITNTTYGNWYLEDSTGEIFIYGTRDKNGNTGKNNSIEAWGIESGDMVTVEGPRKTYNGLIELVDVTVLGIKKNKETMQITLSATGNATFFSSESAYSLPNGLSAQVVTNISNGKLIYKTIADGSVNGIVPMGIAVMLVSDAKQAGTYTLTSSDSAITYTGTNLLHGSDNATTTTGDGLHYKLSYGPSGTGWSDVFGWYWGAQNGAPFQIEGHKAWLVVQKSNYTRAAGFSIEGDILGIEQIGHSQSTVDKYYDLQGRYVNQPSKKGLYIRNGKKIVK